MATIPEVFKVQRMLSLCPDCETRSVTYSAKLKRFKCRYRFGRFHCPFIFTEGLDSAAQRDWLSTNNQKTGD